LKLLSQLEEREPLLLARRLDTLAVRRQTRLVGGGGFALPLPELRQVRLQLTLAAVKIGGPRH
jgi:hypothetical protein